MTTIIVTHEDNEVDEFQFDAAQRTITLGRRSSNDVCIPDLSVSGNHATITIENHRVVLQDLNSTNGSYVNGQVIKNTTLNADDEIILGKILLSISSDTLPTHSDHEAHSATHSSDASYETASQESLSPSRTPSESALEVNGASRQQSGNANSGSSMDAQADLLASANELDLEPHNTSNAISNGTHRPPTAPDTAAPQLVTEHTSQRSNTAEAHPLEGIEHLVVPATKATATPMHELDSPAGSSRGAVIEIKNGAKSGQILPIDKPVTTLGRPGIQIAAIMRKPDGYFLMHIESDGDVDKPTLNGDDVGDERVPLNSGDKLTVAGIAVEFMLS